MLEAFSWSMVALSLAGTVLNIRRRRACFYLWCIGNAGWTAVDLYHGIYSQAALQAVYFGLSVWGIVAWKR